MSGQYVIYPLHLGTTIRDNAAAEFLKNPGEKINLPVLAYYVTNGRDRILVDNGGDPADGLRHMPYYQEEEQFPDRQLARLGVKCEDIPTVILTHLHWDHSYNNHLFPGAKFYVQKKELQYAAAPLPVQSHLYDQKVIFQTKYEIIDGDAEIMDGIRVMLTPGHSKGSQTVLVDTEAGVYAICGDFVNTYKCWESSPKIVNGLHTDIEIYYEYYEKLEKRCDHVLPGHDLRVLEHKCYPPPKN